MTTPRRSRALVPAPGTGGGSRPPRVAVVADLCEEGWHSMDLLAEMLLAQLAAPGPVSIRRRIEVAQLRPAMTRRLTRLPGLRCARSAETVDRIVNRHRDYPRWLRSHRHDFDLFHIVDHSYAHLALVLPPDRAVVSCHDLDAFGSANRRSSLRGRVTRELSRRLAAGLARAARIVCGSEATREELLARGLVDADRVDRVRVIPNGVHPTCSPRADARADAEATALLGPPDPDRPELLHVGSAVPRKRIDVLLRILAGLAASMSTGTTSAPDGPAGPRLVRVGELTPRQRRLAAALGVSDRVTELPFVDRRVLAAIYRRATLLLQPSSREGFGLPVVEALACGTPVVASDLPALREVGSDVLTYCPVGEVSTWVRRIEPLLLESRLHPARYDARQVAGRAWAERFSWREHASRMTDVYLECLAPAGTPRRLDLRSTTAARAS